MANIVLTHAKVKMGSSAAPTTTLYGKVTAATINYSAELHENTAYGTGTKSRLAGLKDWSIALTLNQDFGSSDFDKFMFGLVGANSTAGWIQVSPTSGKGSAANPRYCGRGLLEGYSPISGSVGDPASHTITLQAGGVLSRLITSGP